MHSCGTILAHSSFVSFFIDQTLNHKTQPDSPNLDFPQGAKVMRRIYVATLAALVLTGALLIVPVSRSSVTRAEVSEGERLAMYSKPAVVRIIDGIAGQYVFLSPKNETLTFNPS